MASTPAAGCYVVIKGDAFSSISGGLPQLTQALEKKGFIIEPTLTRRTNYAIICNEKLPNRDMNAWIAKAIARGVSIVKEADIVPTLLQEKDITPVAGGADLSHDKHRASNPKKAPLASSAAESIELEAIEGPGGVKAAKCVFIKGSDFPAVAGGHTGLVSMLEAANIRVVKSLSARVTHVIVSESWKRDLPANAAWLSKQQAQGKTIVMESDVGAFLSISPVSVGSKRRRESAGGTPASAPGASPAPKKARIDLSPGILPTEATISVGTQVVTIPASSTDAVLMVNVLQPSGRTLKLQAGSQTTISSVKAALALHESVTASDVRLILSGRELQDDSTLQQSKVVDGCSLLMSLRIAQIASTSATTTTRPAPSPVPPPRDPNAYHPSAPQFPDPVPGEQRLRPWRPFPSHDAQTRILRANTQRMFLVDRRSSTASGISAAFDVLGSTGNIYTVTIARSVKCTCPDAARGNQPCKHVIFVLLKVLKVPSSNPLTWQVSYMTHELDYMLTHAPDPSRNAVLASDAVRAAAAIATGRDLGLALSEGADDVGSSAGSGSAAENRRAVEADEPCAICFDDMGANMALLTYCISCGNNMHKDCMQQWANTKRSRGEAVSCPYCRGTWTDPSAAKAAATAIAPVRGAKASKQGGFINLAEVAGISKSRDTSTYHSYSYRGYHKGRGGYDDYD